MIFSDRLCASESETDVFPNVGLPAAVCPERLSGDKSRRQQIVEDRIIPGKNLFIGY